MACSANCWGLFSSASKVLDPSTWYSLHPCDALICMLEEEDSNALNFILKHVSRIVKYDGYDLEF